MMPRSDEVIRFKIWIQDLNQSKQPKATSGKKVQKIRLQ